MILDGTEILKSHSDSLERLQLILRLPLTNHVDYSRITDVSTLSLIVQSAEHQIGLAELVGQFNQIEPQRILATIGWLLKYQIVNVIGME